MNGNDKDDQQPLVLTDATTREGGGIRRSDDPRLPKVPPSSASESRDVSAASSPVIRPEPRVVAQGQLGSGERWQVTVSGSRQDYRTLITTTYVDGHFDEGGFAGPPVHPGQVMNPYVGRSDRDLVRILVRATPEVTSIRVIQEVSAQELRLRPVGSDPEAGVVFFADLLPVTEIRAIEACDLVGRILEIYQVPPWPGHRPS